MNIVEALKKVKNDLINFVVDGLNNKSDVTHTHEECGNSDTVDGKHAEDFVLATIFNEMIGDTPVSEQISAAIETNGVPSVTTSDNGKILRVVDGTPAWQALTNASEVGF